MSLLHLTELNIYPIKSCGAVAREQIEIDRFGLKSDRRWMLVDERGVFVTQRKCPKMAHIKASIRNGALQIQLGERTLLVEQKSLEAEKVLKVTVWRDICEALPAPSAINQAISHYLGLGPCTLVYMPETVQRLVDKDYAKLGETVSFADGFPLLLTTTPSLQQFNRWLRKNGANTGVSMQRFRPNLVLDGCEAFAEDHWSVIKIGEILFDVVKPCARCAIPTINPETLEKEPAVFKTLKQHRGREGDVYFGQNLIPRGTGMLRMGDQVELLE